MSRRVMTVFRSRLRTDGGVEYGDTAAEMEARARAMPGFVDFKHFVADDGEGISLIVFANRATHEAWRDDPAHRAAQQRGRDDWYAEYEILVGEVAYEHRWAR
jgi:heme-degrading monooxygenase HmoA